MVEQSVSGTNSEVVYRRVGHPKLAEMILTLYFSVGGRVAAS
jgi:hypothetical protein